MSQPDEPMRQQPPSPQTGPDPSESQGGAGMADPDAPIGFTADVGGEPGTEDDPQATRDAVPEASQHGPVTDAERHGD